MTTEYENESAPNGASWTFGIPYKPYRGRYTPEEYGKYLRSMSPQEQNENVSYGVSTELREGVNLDGTLKEEI